MLFSGDSAIAVFRTASTQHVVSVDQVTTQTRSNMAIANALRRSSLLKRW